MSTFHRSTPTTRSRWGLIATTQLPHRKVVRNCLVAVIAYLPLWALCRPAFDRVMGESRPTATRHAKFDRTQKQTDDLVERYTLWPKNIPEGQPRLPMQARPVHCASRCSQGSRAWHRYDSISLVRLAVRLALDEVAHGHFLVKFRVRPRRPLRRPRRDQRDGSDRSIRTSAKESGHRRKCRQFAPNPRRIRGQTPMP